MLFRSTAPKTFRDEEYIEPKNIFEKAGIEVITASTIIGTLYGKIKIKAESQMLVKDIKVEDFDGIFFVGGMGSSVYFEDKFVHKLVWDFFNANKIVSAICIAPTILANSGVLKDKKATVFPDGAPALINGGAIYTAKDVETDGNIITANGPQSATAFANKFLTLLK